MTAGTSIVPKQST